MAIGYPNEVDEAAWKKHDLAVNQCRGRLILFSIAQHLGLPPDDIDVIERKCQAGNGEHEDDIEASGTIRRWCTEGNRPRQDSVRRIKEATHGGIDLAPLVNHPLIESMRREPSSINQLNRCLEQSSSSVRKILYLEPDQRGEFSHHLPERRTVLALRDTWSFDAFLAMLYLAKRGEVLGSTAAHSLPAMCAYDMFPKIVRAVPIIQFQWRQIAQCLHRIFWDRVYDCAIRIDFSLETLHDNVQAFATTPHSRYALKSGKRLNDQEYLKLQFDQLLLEQDRLRSQARQKIDEKLQLAQIERILSSSNSGPHHRKLGGKKELSK